MNLKQTISIVLLLACGAALHTSVAADTEEQFFTSQIEPLLREHCFECHSHEKKIKGGLTLDSKSGWERGGDGGPAVIPGAPEKSRLIKAVRYADEDLQMPPKKKLADAQIELLERWVKQGAPDPRSSATTANSKTDWESIYQQRLKWWSLQPLANVQPPPVHGADWLRNEVDQFILASLEAKGVNPVAEVDRRTLARRLSFALTGLPPKADDVERYASNTSADADAEFLQSLLDSPHFGEHWARHWMDVVHYSDTHGYEWDVPAKFGWRYRDYLIRAFNADVSFKQLILEQIAGDLIEPRIDPNSGINESLLGPMAMRLGERRHGDNSAIEGISQEAVANVIDTISKGFLATTVGCAQCHDHKLDAVEQRDYYGLAGVLMSTRWGARCVDAVDTNLAVLEELRRIKSEIRNEVVKLWRQAGNSVAQKIAAPPAEDAKPSDPKSPAKSTTPPATGFPDSLQAIWRNLEGSASTSESLETAWKALVAEFQTQREKRIAENQANLRLLADFTREETPAGWQVEGFGMRHGLAKDGELVLALAGDGAIAHLLPAGRWSHVWSTRLAGAVRSPMFGQDPPPTIAIGHAGGKFAAQSLIVEQAFHGEHLTFINRTFVGWHSLATGHFVALSGTADPASRRVYLELATKSLNNNFPPRVGLGGMKEEEINDEHSWFGVTRIYEHPAGKPPQDELGRFSALFADASIPHSKDELASKLAELVMVAINRWNQGQCDSEDVRLINEALSAKWLSNDSTVSPQLSQLITSYRQAEQRLQADRTAGSTADWNEGRNERIGIRGSYTDFGDEVPRGNIRFLGGAATRLDPQSSGRLELARNIASDQNPLTARVIVNRVWLHLFGSGLVRTPDDFGHLGEKPSHPELLDYLSNRFIAEGWSVKKLVTLLVTSAAWRQSSIPNEAAIRLDPENRLWHHLPMRRLEAEAIRDSMLVVAGRLDASLYGPPTDPPRAAQDAAKRLFSGPLDGNGRRSIYTKMTLMEPPRFLAIFNQPIPKLTVGRRDATNVPNQALALLNDSLVVAMAKFWSERIVNDQSQSAQSRIERMFATAFARPPAADETVRLLKLVSRSAEIRGVDGDALLACQPVWQDVAHALFNLKEFIYVQ